MVQQIYVGKCMLGLNDLKQFRNMMMTRVLIKTCLTLTVLTLHKSEKK